MDGNKCDEQKLFICWWKNKYCLFVSGRTKNSKFVSGRTKIVENPIRVLDKNCLFVDSSKKK